MTRASWAGPGKDAASQTLEDARRVWKLVDAFTEVRKRESLPKALVELAAELPGVTGAAVMDLGLGQEPDVAAFSDEDARHLSQLQLSDADGGPGLEALRTGAPVMLEGLENGPAGPSTLFTRAARDLGVGYVCALPISRHSRRFGSLLLYGRGREPLGSPDLAALRRWVDITGVGLAQRQALREAEEREDQLDHALVARVVIEQAKGVLVGQDAPDVSAAFEVLRGRARAARMRVEDVARDVVAEAASPSEHPAVPLRWQPAPEDGS
jgi:hypothetical protein